MADNNVALSQDNRSEFFADDDPLAELARIVGFEDRPVANAPAAQARREPEFNLEDELLREFELYEAPRLDAVDEISVDAPLSGATQPADPFGDDYDHSPAQLSEPVQQQPVFLEPTFEEPTFEEPRIEPAAFAAWPEAVEPEPAVSEFASDPMADENDAVFATPATEPDVSYAAEAWEQAEVASEMPGQWEPVDDASAWVDAGQGDEPVAEVAPPAVEADDGVTLADELEFAIGEAPVVEPVRPQRQDQTPTLHFRLPLANFAPVNRSQTWVEPQPEVPEAREAVLSSHDMGFTPEHDRHEEEAPAAEFHEHVAYAPVAVEEPVIEPEQPQETEPQIAWNEPAAVSAAPESSKPQEFSALDELIYDVARYPLPSSSPAPAVARTEPAFEAAPAPVERAAEVVAPVAAAPAAVEEPSAPAPQAEPVAEAPAIRQEAAIGDDLPFDPFADDAFELALDDLELDLSEIVIEEQPPKTTTPSEVSVAAAAAAAASVITAASRTTPVAAAAPAPASIPTPAAPAPAAPVASVVPSRETQPPVHQTPVRAAQPEAVGRPAVVTPVAATAAAAQPEDLPFDPALFADTDEHPESIPEVDVPALPSNEPDVAAPAYRPDYDLDIDTELAVLFNSPSTGGLNRQSKAAPAQAATPAQAPVPAQTVSAHRPSVVTPVAAPVSTVSAAAAPAASVRAGDLPDFDKVIEEDFLQSLRQPVEQDAGPQRMALNAEEQEFYDEGSGRRRKWLMPAAVGGVVLLAAGGLYAWMSDSGSTVASGNGPIIIAADKDPVKIVPEDRGGKTVPNQDKAVYDRVAGTGQSDPQQESLISTSEEPVDVVQRTLIPETLPLEGENDFDAAWPTPVGETEDPRLLPRDEQPAGVAENDNSAAGTVAPRRVRTMIVKPDGTLVAQELPAEPSAPAAIAPVADAPVAELASPEDSIEVANAAPSQPAPTGDTLADNGVRVVRTTTISDTAPVPAARPADQEANIVATVTEQGNVSTPAPAAPQPVAQPPVAQQPAAQPAEQQVAAVPPGGYVIQIASLPSEAEAQKTYESLSARHAGIIGGRGVDIRRAEIEGRGTFYRVRIPAGDRAQANALCERYKQAGGSCLVTR